MGNDGPVVLVVDDDRGDIALVDAALGAVGLRVVGVTDPDETFGRLAAERADLVIVDALLPGVSGFELCRRIKASTTMPVVILTGVYLKDQYRREAIEQFKADGFLTKPFRPPELQRLVLGLLEGAEPGEAEAGAGASVKESFWTRLFRRRRRAERARVELELTRLDSPPRPEPPARTESAADERAAAAPVPPAGDEPAPSHAEVELVEESVDAADIERLLEEGTRPEEEEPASAAPGTELAGAAPSGRAEESVPTAAPPPSEPDARGGEDRDEAELEEAEGEEAEGEEKEPERTLPLGAAAAELLRGSVLDRGDDEAPAETTPSAATETAADEEGPSRPAEAEGEPVLAPLEAEPVGDEPAAALEPAVEGAEGVSEEEATFEAPLTSPVDEEETPGVEAEDEASGEPEGEGRAPAAAAAKEPAAEPVAPPVRRPLGRFGDVPVYEGTELEHELRRELSKCRRVDRPLALVLVEVEDLGQFVELFGKGFADRALWYVAELAVDTVREVDLVGFLDDARRVVLTAFACDRYGGERIVARLRRAVAGRPLTVGEGIPPIAPRLRFGIAAYPEDGAGVDELLRHAAAAMEATTGRLRGEGPR